MACVPIWQLLCVVCIYTRERYRPNKYPNLQWTAPNIWMWAFSWTKGKEPIKHTMISIAETLELGSFLKIWDEMNISLHCSGILVITKMPCWGKNTGKNGHRLKSLEQGHLGLEWNVRFFYIGTHHFKLAPKPKLWNYTNRIKFVFV